MKHGLTLKTALREAHAVLQRYSKTMTAREIAAMLRVLDHAGTSVSRGRRTFRLREQLPPAERCPR